MIDYTYIGLILFCILAVLTLLYFDRVKASTIIAMGISLIGLTLLGFFVYSIFGR